jgi:chromosome segregation ATPase
VKRQNEVISRYQARGIQPVADDGVERRSGDTALQDWLLSARHMSPMFLAYDDRVSELERERGVLQDSLTQLRAQCEGVVKENDALHSQLREHVAELVRHGEQGATETIIRGGRARELDEWAETQERMDLLTQENDLMLQQTRSLHAELERTRSELAARVHDQAATLQQLAEANTAFQRTAEEAASFHAEAERIAADVQAAAQRETTLGQQLAEAARRIRGTWRAGGTDWSAGG